MNFFIFLAILIIVLLYKPSMIEGFKPNEDQFSICDDRSEKGETNYHQEKNLIKNADHSLLPIEGINGFNHLPVRGAISIILDRLLGLRELPVD